MLAQNTSAAPAGSRTPLHCSPAAPDSAWTCGSEWGLLGARVESGVRGCGGAIGPVAGGDYLWVQMRGILGGCRGSGCMATRSLSSLISRCWLPPRDGTLCLCFPSQGPSLLLGKRGQKCPTAQLPSISCVWHAGFYSHAPAMGAGPAP